MLVVTPLGGVRLMGGAVVEGAARTDWSPLGGAAGDVSAARDLGMAATIFHWALHPWSIFGGGAAYVRELIPLSMPFGREDTNFVQGWTAFYWAWWISWSPFVGMFIARVSRGRTVREFVTCVILVPTVVCVIWMGAFGGTAISQVVADAGAPVAEAALELKLFEMLAQLPLSTITSFLGIVLVLVFFVTSSDSGSLVIDTITAGGKIDAPAAQRVFWCVFEGLVAATLLLVGGATALTALQAMSVSTGFPFTIVLLVMCVSLFMGLNGARKQRQDGSPVVAQA